MTSAPEPRDDAPELPSLREATRVWAKVGVLSFGGPAAQIALLHDELVARRRWVDEPRFAHALRYCLMLPGPEATQLAIYLGWLMHGVRGGAVAGTLFVLPGFLVLLALSSAYVAFRALPASAALLAGLRVAVVALVAVAVVRLGKRALGTPAHVVLAVLALVAVAALHAPFPLVVALAALAGLVLPPAPGDAHAAGDGPATSAVDRCARAGTLAHLRASRPRALALAAVVGALWLAPLGLLWLARTGIFAELAWLFTRTALVTFGGAYSVLGYVGDEAVRAHHWLTPPEMLDALGLAETTPGPLIIVLDHVGFVAAANAPTGLPPLVAGALGALIAAWQTFTPCFLWVLAPAPWVEGLREQRTVARALSGVSAAVVGVIASLGVWLAVHALSGEVRPLDAGPVHLELPVLATLRPVALALATVGAVAVARFRVPQARVLVALTALGALAWSLGWH